jgi:hypothetical protein
MLLNYIHLPVFLISFAVGLFFVYILGPELKTIYIYPTPENINKILFKDKADNCFSFEEQYVDCPSNNSLLSKLPIQI